MTLVVTWDAVCDGCGLKQSRRKELNIDPEDDIRDGVTTSYLDIWGHGIPDGWITAEEPTVLLFHSEACYTDWLRRIGRNDDADSVEKATYIF